MIQGGGGYLIRRYQNEYKIRTEILKKRGKEKKLKKKKRNCLLTCFFWLIKKQQNKIGNGHLTKLKFCR